MTQGPIGEAHVLVVPDLSRFSAELKAKLGATVQSVKEPKVRVEADLSRFSAEVRAYLARFDPKEQVKIAAALDRSSFAKVVAEAKRVAAGADAKINVKADTRQATSSLSSLRRSLTSTGQESRNFESTIKLLKFPLLVGGAQLAAQAINALGAAAVGLASSLGQLAGVLAALPAVAGAAAQGIFTLLFAFAGVGKALKAYSTLQASAGAETAKTAKTAASSGETQRRAAESVANAQRALVRVQRDGAQTAVDALRSVRDAQEDLTRARRDALDNLKDLRLEERGLSLSQEEATLRIAEAQAELRRVLADPPATALERQRAELRVRQAKLERDEIGRRVVLNRQEIRQGVSGADQVIAARERVTDAQRAATRSAQSSARSITDAQRAVTQALRDQRAAASRTASAAAAGSGAANAFNQAMAKLAPAGQRFVRFLISLRPAVARLQQAAQSGLLPGVERGIRVLLPLLPLVERVLHETGLALGDIAEKGARMLASGPWRRDFAALARQNTRLIRTFGDVGLNLADALRNIAIAAGPLVDWLADLTLQWSEQIKGAAATGRQTGKLAEFFDRTRATAEKFIRILGDLGVGLFNVLAAAAPLGDHLLELLGNLAERFRAFTESTHGRRELAEFFEQAKPAIEEALALVEDVGKALVGFGTGPGLASLIRQIRTEFLPVLVRAGDQLSDTFAPAIVEALTSFVRLLGDLGDQGGTLVILARTLGGIADALDFLVREVPGFRQLLGVMIAFAAVSRALRFTAAVLGIKEFVGWLLKLVPAARAAAVANAALSASMLNLGAAGVAGFAVFEEGKEQLRALKTGSLDARDPMTLLIDTVFGLNLGLSKESIAAKDAAGAIAAHSAAQRAGARATAENDAANQRAIGVLDALGTAVKGNADQFIGYSESLKTSRTDVAASLRTQTGDFKAWSKDVQALIKRGMSPAEIIKLQEQGPGFVHKFATATDTEFAKLKGLWQERLRQARIAVQIEALAAGSGSAQSIATGLLSKDKEVRAAARSLLKHVPSKIQTEVEVLYDHARNIQILRKFAAALHTTIGGKPVLIDPRTGRAEPIRNAAGNLFTERHAAQIARAGAMRLWAEPETGGEAYIPLALSKRPRSESILAEVARRFGMRLERYQLGGIRPGLGLPKLGIGTGSRYELVKLLAMALPSLEDRGQGGKQGTDGLVAHVRAAREYIRQVFGVQNIGGFAKSGHVANSDHYTGHALDVMTGSRALHKAVIEWFRTLSTAKYWISFSRIATAARGWVPRPYSGSSPHRDHVHLSFFHGGGRIPEDIFGVGPSGRAYAFQQGETVKSRAASAASAREQLSTRSLHVENLIVQPLSGRFRLADVLTELALQGVR